MYLYRLTSADLRLLLSSHVFVTLNAIVILPDHLHCLWKLPEKDNDFSMRWRLIKRYFSMEMDTSVNHRKEKEVWRRRFWEYAIRDVLVRMPSDCIGLEEDSTKKTGVQWNLLYLRG